MIDLTQQIMDVDFKPVKREEGFLTLEHVCCQAVMVTFGEEKESQQSKDKKFRLWLKMVNKKEVSLKAEEIALIKEQINKTFSVIVYGQAVNMLEGLDPFDTGEEGKTVELVK